MVALKNSKYDQAGTPTFTEQTFVIRQHSGSQKGERKNLRRQHVQVSKLMIFALVVMISGFIMATPLSLVLTIPAYILADKVS